MSDISNWVLWSYRYGDKSFSCDHVIHNLREIVGDV